MKEKEKIKKKEEEEISLLKERSKKADEYYDKLLRLAAEFDNFRKRVEQERKEFVEYASRTLVSKFLPLLDTLENGLNPVRSKASNGTKDKEEFFGLNLIYKELVKILSGEGLTKQKIKGENFDPLYHEAVEVVEGNEDNKIVEEVRPGYLYHNRLLRPAIVKVSKKIEGKNKGEKWRKEG